MSYIDYHKDFCTLSVQIDTFLKNTKDSFYGYKRTAPIIFGPMFIFGQQFCPRDRPRDHYQY